MGGSFVFYNSFYESLEYLADEERLKALTYIIEYGLYGKEPTPNGSTSYALYLMAKPQIDANKLRRENGKKGGAPKGNQNASKTTIGCKENNHRLYGEQPNVNVNDNENVNDKDNVNENDNGVLGEEEETLLPWERPITLTRQVGDLTKGLMRKTSL